MSSSSHPWTGAEGICRWKDTMRSSRGELWRRSCARVRRSLREQPLSTSSCYHPTFLLLATESTAFNVTLEGRLWQGIMSDMTKPYQLLSFDGSEQRLLWTQQVGYCAADEVVFCSLQEIRSNSFWTPGSVVPIPVARSTSRSRTVMGTCKAWYWYESWHFCWRGHHLLWMSVIVHLVSCFIQSLLVVNSYGRDLCHTLYKVHIMWFWMQIFKIISNPVC